MSNMINFINFYTTWRPLNPWTLGPLQLYQFLRFGKLWWCQIWFYISWAFFDGAIGISHYSFHCQVPKPFWRKIFLIFAHLLQLFQILMNSRPRIKHRLYFIGCSIWRTFFPVIGGLLCPTSRRRLQKFLFFCLHILLLPLLTKYYELKI